jgi:hypothetical protein
MDFVLAVRSFTKEELVFDLKKISATGWVDSPRSER